MAQLSQDWTNFNTCGQRKHEEHQYKDNNSPHIPGPGPVSELVQHGPVEPGPEHLSWIIIIMDMIGINNN